MVACYRIGIKDLTSGKTLRIYDVLLQDVSNVCSNESLISRTATFSIFALIWNVGDEAKLIHTSCSSVAFSQECSNLVCEFRICLLPLCSVETIG